MDKPTISMAKGTDPAQVVDEAASLLRGVDTLIEPNSTVAVKPNESHDYSRESSVKDCPGVVAAAIRERRRG